MFISELLLAINLIAFPETKNDWQLIKKSVKSYLPNLTIIPTLPLVSIHHATFMFYIRFAYQNLYPVLSGAHSTVHKIL